MNAQATAAGPAHDVSVARELLAATVPVLTLAAIVDSSASVLLHRVQEHLATADG